MLTSKVTADPRDIAAARKFAAAEYWQPEHVGLFAEGLTMDMPYAPPGMYQHLGPQECDYHFRWLTNTVSGWRYAGTPKVYATDHPGLFWVFREGQGKVHWANKDGIFKSKLAALLHIKDAQIDYIKEHFDMTAFYDATGVELPHFIYDAPDPATLTPRAPAPIIKHTPESLQKQVQSTLNFFINPGYWAPEVNCVLADDFIHELVFTPSDMPRKYVGTEYDAINAWLAGHMGETKIFDTVFYNTDDPHIYIAEFNCYVDTSWSGVKGHYMNREISYIEINEAGLCTRLDEYFNTMSKFNSIGASVPSFPYMF
jgi:hypothetical protein